MKKYLLSVVATSILLSGVAYAQKMAVISPNTYKDIKENIQLEKDRLQQIKASTTANIKNERENLKQEKASTTANIKNKIGELKNEIENRAQEKIAQQKTQVLKEFTNVISSLENIATRTESRITKLTTLGIDMSSSTSLLNTAKTNIANAKIEFENLKTIVSQVNSTTTPKLLKNQIKSQSEKTRNAIKIAKKSLNDVIVSVARSQELKKEARRDERNASSTASTTRR